MASNLISGQTSRTYTHILFSVMFLQPDKERKGCEGEVEMADSASVNVYGSFPVVLLWIGYRLFNETAVLATFQPV